MNTKQSKWMIGLSAVVLMALSAARAATLRLPAFARQFEAPIGCQCPLTRVYA